MSAFLASINEALRAVEEGPSGEDGDAHRVEWFGIGGKVRNAASTSTAPAAAPPKVLASQERLAACLMSYFAVDYHGLRETSGPNVCSEIAFY